MALLAKAWHWEAVEGLEVSLPEGSLLPHCGCQLTATAPACQRASVPACCHAPRRGVHGLAL